MATSIERIIEGRCIFRYFGKIPQQFADCGANRTNAKIPHIQYSLKLVKKEDLSERHYLRIGLCLPPWASRITSLSFDYLSSR